MERQENTPSYGFTKAQPKSNQQPGGIARKLIIKPLKSKPKLPPDFEKLSWGKLKDAVQAVFAKRPVSCSMEELYVAVEDMCMHRMADRIYSRLQEECDAHTAGELLKLSERQTLDPVAFLKYVEGCWQDYCSQMLTIRSLFLYLDRTYVLASASVRSLFEMSLQLFRAHLAQYPQVGLRTVEGMLRLIEAERQGETVDRLLLNHLIRMFTSLGIYTESFQGPFLAETSRFYANEGVKLMQELKVSEYLLHCERRLGEEYDRCAQYLDAATRRPLVGAVEEKLLEAHLPGVLEKGFDTLMSERSIPDLARLYSLAGRIHAVDSIKLAFKEYIKKTGFVIVMDEEKDKEMVALLLQLKIALDSIWVESFARSESFGNALKEAFESFINQRANKPAELIAKFIDGELRMGNKGQTEEELEATLDRALILFRYIQGKDVFEAFYKKDLAKRLLLGKSASTDAEKAMISKLKAECGAQFTNKLEGMFKDVDLSHDIMGSFHQSNLFRTEVEPSGIDVNVNVLTSGYWPSYPIIDAKLPGELSDMQSVFKEFYLSKHSGRKLVWHNSLATCVVRAHFPKGTKELSLSLFQTVVLMLFNDVEQLSLAEIAEATGIEDKELRRTLQSIACGKMRVLLKEPKGREVGDDDVFTWNEGFTASLYRLKINSIQLKETVEENAKTNDQVLQDRQYQIDAAIVRVMKTRKTLGHKLLVQELMVQLKFPIKAGDLKKRIESLIEREYLERDPNDLNVYNYLA